MNEINACQLFSSQQELQSQTDRWQRILNNYQQQDVFSWAVGMAKPPRRAINEAQSQMQCLLDSINQTTDIKLTEKATIHSDYRNFQRQLSIWLRKYHFKGKAFDKITTDARLICQKFLLDNDQHWSPNNIRHQLCWLGTLQKPPLLSSDQKQIEILQASAAPGISRHHWGTDFDIIDRQMNQASWNNNGKLYPTFQWLKKNASHYGFIQPYNLFDLRNKPSYMEEGWHWSYSPIANALLNYLQLHETQFNQYILSLWENREEFSYIRKQF